MRQTLAILAVLTLFAPKAFAHVTANPNMGEAGSYFQTSFRISHGCDGSDTTSVHISIPPGFLSLKPQAKPGWKIETTKRKLAKPVSSGHGKMTDEEFSDITWSGGNLSDSQYDDFGLLIKLPDTPDKMIYFPVTQTCIKGKNAWTEIPVKGKAWHDLEHPAPFVHVMGAASDDMNMHH